MLRMSGSFLSHFFYRGKTFNAFHNKVVRFELEQYILTKIYIMKLSIISEVNEHITPRVPDK